MSYTNHKKPTHRAYTVRENSNKDNDYWTKIGVAFAHNDGKGFSIMLDAVPLDGKITLRIAESQPKKSTSL